MNFFKKLGRKVINIFTSKKKRLQMVQEVEKAYGRAFLEKAGIVSHDIKVIRKKGKREVLSRDLLVDQKFDIFSFKDNIYNVAKQIINEVNASIGSLKSDALASREQLLAISKWERLLNDGLPAEALRIFDYNFDNPENYYIDKVRMISSP